MRRIAGVIAALIFLVALGQYWIGQAAPAHSAPTQVPTVQTPTVDAYGPIKAHILAKLGELQTISDSMKGATNDQVTTDLGAIGLLLATEADWLSSNVSDPPAPVQVYSSRLDDARTAVLAAVAEPTNATVTAAGKAVTSLLGCRGTIGTL